MSLGKFLKDKLGVCLLWLGLLLITCLVLWLTPSVHFNLSSLIYIALLQGIALIVYLSVSYGKKQKWLLAIQEQENRQDFLAEHLEHATSEEQKIVQTYINQLISDQRDALEEVIQTQQDQKDFIDSWVHEIKVPLASVKLLNETIEDEIQERQFYQLENDLQKIESYVDQVLYYSRLDTFSRDYLIQETSLKSIVLPLIRQNANYFIQRNLHYSIEGDDYEILTDQKWLGFILNQVISNAIKYTPDNGAITIRLSQNERGNWLEIKDTGIGIPLADQRRIFDKGFTGQTGRNQTHHSTGLGLYLAKNLAEKLGHHIYVESTEGQGTTISLLFPFLTYYTDGQEEKLID